MPIYEYKCQQCSAHTEVRQAVSEDPLKICQKCGGPLEKQWSLSGFQFKGQGWYVTDYSGKNAPPAGAGSDKSEKNSAAESTVKPEAASKTKSEAAPSPAKLTDSKKD